MTSIRSRASRRPGRARALPRRALAVVATTVLAMGGLAACGDSNDSNSSAKAITVWIEEDLPDRVQATQKIVDAFTQETGVKVKLVAVAEDQFNQLLTSSAAAGDLPDVVGALPLGQLQTMGSNDLVDTGAVADVIDDLDASTFSERAMDLVKADGDALGVPGESWAQLLYYRKDLFDKAGLPAPSTYDDILKAAKTLDSSDMAGFVGANSPGDAFTEQTFEHVALGNGCQLVDNDGKVTIGSKACQDALSFYGTLVHDYSVPGAQDVDTTRATYFAGKAAMFIWSTFALDEMAGLRNDALPTCPECKKDPAFLAKNTGVVTTLQGPDSDTPAVFGEVTSWTLTNGSATDPAKKFVEYMMGDGYRPWLQIAPEGKVPVRTGTPDNKTEFSDAWAKMSVGVDKKAPLSDFYSKDVLAALAEGPNDLARWGISEGQGALIGALQGEQPVPSAVNDVTSGADPADVTAKLSDQITSIQDSLK
jgi:multiple sugar transport system substrate-binding protein